MGLFPPDGYIDWSRSVQGDILRRSDFCIADLFRSPSGDGPGSLSG